MSVKKTYYSEDGSNYLEIDYYNEKKMYVVISDEDGIALGVSLTIEDIRHLIAELETKIESMEVSNG